MNLQVDLNYKAAVDGFAFPGEPMPSDQLKQLVPDDQALEKVTNDIGKIIIAASQLRPNLTAMAGRDLSLADVCYIYGQQQDSKSGITTTASRIREATPDMKGILKHTFKKLSELFEQVNTEDIKVATLLFGIHRIYDLVNGKIIAAVPSMTIREQMAVELAKLESLRSKYGQVPGVQQDLLNKLDDSIVEGRAKLAALDAQAAAHQEAVNQ